MKIVGLIALIILVLICIILINKKLQANKVKKITESADIYITYVDYTASITPKKGTYDLINIKEKKLYQINWKVKNQEITSGISEFLNYTYKINTRNISDDEISQLLDLIDEEKEKTKNQQKSKNKEKSYIPPDVPPEDLLENHFNIEYKGETVSLDGLPFSY